MELEQLIAAYGYAAVVIGTMAEGEMVLLAASMLAGSELLSLPGVMAAAVAGSLTGDQLFFRLGRHYGSRILERRESWKKKSRRLFRRLHHHQVWMIIGFRFIYGFRAVVPIVLGAGRIHPIRFTVFNGIGASAWVTVFAVTGYFVGPYVLPLIGRIMPYKYPVLIGLVSGICLWRIVYHLRNAHPRKRLFFS